MTKSDTKVRYAVDRANEIIEELRRIAWMAIGTAAASVVLNIVLLAACWSGS